MSQVLPRNGDVEIHDSQFFDNSINVHHTTNNISTVNNAGISGLKLLLDSSVPEALHDSSARDPPPRCHPGTRYDYIDRVTRWALDNDGREHRMIWVYGPAGVGKSAVAQSCAETIAKSGKLGAAFFFSMPNKRDKPNYLFTTISYQLAMGHAPCRQILDTMIQQNPTLLTKSIKQQFHDLIATPLAELRARGEDMNELVIIIDGLDECADTRAQCEIVDIIAESIRDQTTPFLWVIVSRPEAHIHAKFASPQILSLSTYIELPVSRDIDHEITKFLTDELREIQTQHGLPESWPTERQIGTLVNLSAGLFIYASTAIRFIKDENSSGPDDQLQVVLALKERSVKENETHPLSELDSFYTLIMKRIPQKILPTIQKVLFATTLRGGIIASINANLVGLSETQFRNACRPLHSVLVLDGPGSRMITFYHASFMEFLLDPRRSQSFCIKSDCAAALGMELLDRLSMVYARSSSYETIDIPMSWPGVIKQEVLNFTVHAFLASCQSAPLNDKMLIALTAFNYAKMSVVWHSRYFLSDLEVDKLLQNIPREFRRKIVRRYPRALFHTALLERPHRNAVWSRPYVLGHGKNKALLWPDRDGGSWIGPYPSSRVVSVAKFVRGMIMGSRKDEVEEPENLDKDRFDDQYKCNTDDQPD